MSAGVGTCVMEFVTRICDEDRFQLQVEVASSFIPPSPELAQVDTTAEMPSRNMFKLLFVLIAVVPASGTTASRKTASVKGPEGKALPLTSSPTTQALISELFATSAVTEGKVRLSLVRKLRGGSCLSVALSYGQQTNACDFS